MTEQTEYWETVKILRAEEIEPYIPRNPWRPDEPPGEAISRARVVFQVLESNKSHRVGNVHTAYVLGPEMITRVLLAYAAGARLIAHTARRLNFYPVE